MSRAGYSHRTLVEKLGIRPGDKIAIIGAPAGYRKTLGPLPPDVRNPGPNTTNLDFVQLFVRDRRALVDQLRDLRKHIKPTGMIWVSWPKQASGVPSDLTEDVIRTVAIETGLVDVKVAAIDETWSGLKLVIRVKDRV
ncbi:MAG TPA: DUF3052 family protein [Thermoplasmata archaeon]|nr:DUF3052 family protein [Thermoplasmata archaeon]